MVDLFFLIYIESYLITERGSGIKKKMCKSDLMIVCIITYLALFVRIRLYFVLTRETHCEFCIVLSVNQSIKFIFQENITKN